VNPTANASGGSGLVIVLLAILIVGAGAFLAGLRLRRPAVPPPD
jgi:hypothetical protein